MCTWLSGAPSPVFTVLTILTGTKGTRQEAQRAELVGGRELLQKCWEMAGVVGGWGWREVTPGHPN